MGGLEEEEESDRAHRRSGIGAVAVAVAVVVASIYPMTWPEGRDSFPVWSHPMFSGRRTDADVRLVVALGEWPGGTEALPTESAGHRHLTQAVRALSEAVSDGGDRGPCARTSPPGSMNIVRRWNGCGS